MPKLLSPFSELLRGLRAFPAGLSWLRMHPVIFLLLALPTFIGVLLFGLSFGLLVSYDQTIFSTILWPRPNETLWLVGYYIVKALLYVTFVALGMLGYVLIVNVVASPIYEYVSYKVEKDMYGTTPKGLSFGQTLWLLVEELKKVFFILFISLLTLVVPGLNVFTLFIAAFLLGWEFYDYPLSRRGWPFRRRMVYVLKDFWAVLGFGFWLVIPFLNLLLVPLAVAGGTILSLDALRRDRLDQV